MGGDDRSRSRPPAPAARQLSNEVRTPGTPDTGRNTPEPSLPRNLLEASATVVLAQNMMQCGILEVDQGRSGVYCFFRAGEVTPGV